MNPRTTFVATLLTSLIALTAHAAPDEDKLGKAQGYPAGNARSWFFDEKVRVGSFSAQGEITGISGGTVKTMAASDKPMPLTHLERAPELSLVDRRC